MKNIDLTAAVKYMMSTGMFHDEQQARDILVASLRALRDRLPKTHAYELGQMLPDTLQKVYFEGWDKVQRQAESVNKSEFITEVEFHLKGYEDHDITDLVPAALSSILNSLDTKEAKHLKHGLPLSMQDIFIDRQAM